MRLEQVVDCPLRSVAVVRMAGRIDAQQPAARAQALRLVECARVRDEVAQRNRRALAIPLEQLRKSLVSKGTVLLQPPWECEVVKGDDRNDAMLVARFQDASVVSESRQRELTFGR